MDRYSYFNQFHLLPEADYALLVESLKIRKFKKGHTLVVPGQVQRELYLVKSGVQMSYYDSGNKMHVIAFTYYPDLCAIPQSFAFQQPATYYLTCLTDSELECITFEQLQVVFNRSQAIERLFRKMTEAILSGLIDRYIELHALSMEERYKAFCQRSPHLLQLVPHKYIASYLGMDATNFSKLYNQIRF